MNRVSVALFAAVALVLVACTQTETSLTTTPQALETVEDVSFLPPIGDSVTLEGNFDDSLDLYIEVFDLEAGMVHVGPTLSVANGGISVVNDPGVEEQYHANWDTTDSPLTDSDGDGKRQARVEIRLNDDSPADPYCGAVPSVASGCIAFFDVELWDNMGQAKKAQRGTLDGVTNEEDFIDLVDGRTLPIKLHVRESAVEEPWAPEWIQQFGTGGLDFARDVVVDDLGNIIVVGLTQGSYGDIQPNAGGDDGFVVRFDPNGNALWRRQFGSGGNDTSWRVTTDSNGNIYVAGFASGSIHGSPHGGARDAILIKYDAAGNRVWTRQFGTNANEEIRALATVESNTGPTFLYAALRVSGSFDGNTHFGSFDITLAKFDASNGNLVESTQVGSGSTEAPFGLAVDGDGNVFVTGGTLGSLDGSDPSAGLWDGFLIKVDSQLNPVWTRMFGLGDGGISFAVATDSTGNAYITGFSGYGGSVDSCTVAGTEDIVLAKYSPAGVVQWVERVGTASCDWSEGVSIDASDNIYVAGSTESVFGSSANAGSEDVVLIRFDTSGATLDTLQVGSNDLDHTFRNTTDASGNIYLVGFTDGVLPGAASVGGRDAFLMKVAP